MRPHKETGLVSLLSVWFLNPQVVIGPNQVHELSSTAKVQALPMGRLEIHLQNLCPTISPYSVVAFPVREEATLVLTSFRTPTTSAALFLFRIHPLLSAFAESLSYPCYAPFLYFASHRIFHQNSPIQRHRNPKQSNTSLQPLFRKPNSPPEQNIITSRATQPSIGTDREVTLAEVLSPCLVCHSLHTHRHCPLLPTRPNSGTLRNRDYLYG